MKSISLLPMIRKRLEREFCSRRILENPRMSEIDDILIAIARNYGMMLNDEALLYPQYQGKLQERAYHLLNMSNIIEMEGGTVRVNMPERMSLDSPYTTVETIEYEVNQDGNLKRTHSITERRSGVNNSQSVSVSIINEDGIEIERRTDTIEGAKSKTYVYERMSGNPNIVRRTTDGINEEVFYDMTNSSRFETLVVSKETRVAKEEIKPMSSEQQEIIMENNRYSDYIEGIKKLIGREKAVSVDDTER